MTFYEIEYGRDEYAVVCEDCANSAAEDYNNFYATPIKRPRLPCEHCGLEPTDDWIDLLRKEH